MINAVKYLEEGECDPDPALREHKSTKKILWKPVRQVKQPSQRSRMEAWGKEEGQVNSDRGQVKGNRQKTGDLQPSCIMFIFSGSFSGNLMLTTVEN